VIVVDTNVITYLVLKGDYSGECESLFRSDCEWAAPRLWRDEMCNVLATYERRQLLRRTDALRAFSNAQEIIAGNEFDMLPERILSVASRTQCSGYDAQYIALAEDLGIHLFTFDKKILSAVPHIARKPG
jgi:predicted nucleic acid-binding protein